MIKVQLLLQLLMRLLAHLTGLDRAGKPLDRGLGGKVGEVVLALTGRAMFADDPDLFARQVLRAYVVDALCRTIGDTPAQGGEAGRQKPFRSAPPTDLLPTGMFQRGLRVDRPGVGDMALSGTPAPGDGKDYRHVGGIDPLMLGNAHRPAQPALA